MTHWSSGYQQWSAAACQRRNKRSNETKHKTMCTFLHGSSYFMFTVDHNFLNHSESVFGLSVSEVFNSLKFLSKLSDQVDSDV